QGVDGAAHHQGFGDQAVDQADNHQGDGKDQQALDFTAKTFLHLTSSTCFAGSRNCGDPEDVCRASGHREPGGKAVAGAAHGLDQLLVAIHGEGVALAADMDVHGAFIHVDIAAPDVVENLIPGVDAVLVAEEEAQQAEFRGSHGDGLVADGDVVTDGIVDQTLHPHYLLRDLRGLAPQHRPGAGDQLPGGEGFGDIVVGARIQTLDHIVL